MAKLEFRKRRIGPLECMEVRGHPDAPTIVMFHGYGANMSDLASLASAVSAPKNSSWYFPNGHLTVPLGAHAEGRAWFQIPLAELQAGAALDLSELIPPGMKKSRENAKAFLAKLEVAPSKLILGGFSQGAMLATDLVLNMDEAPAGLAILSGTLVNQAEWSGLAKARAGFHFFKLTAGTIRFYLSNKLKALSKCSNETGGKGSCSASKAATKFRLRCSSNSAPTFDRSVSGIDRGAIIGGDHQ